MQLQLVQLGKFQKDATCHTILIVLYIETIKTNYKRRYFLVFFAKVWIFRFNFTNFQYSLAMKAICVR